LPKKKKKKFDKATLVLQGDLKPHNPAPARAMCKIEYEMQWDFFWRKTAGKRNTTTTAITWKFGWPRRGRAAASP